MVTIQKCCWHIHIQWPFSVAAGSAASYAQCTKANLERPKSTSFNGVWNIPLFFSYRRPALQTAHSTYELRLSRSCRISLSTNCTNFARHALQLTTDLLPTRRFGAQHRAKLPWSRTTFAAFLQRSSKPFTARPDLLVVQCTRKPEIR